MYGFQLVEHNYRLHFWMQQWTLLRENCFSRYFWAHVTILMVFAWRLLVKCPMSTRRSSNSGFCRWPPLYGHFPRVPEYFHNIMNCNCSIFLLFFIWKKVFELIFDSLTKPGKNMVSHDPSLLGKTKPISMPNPDTFTILNDRKFLNKVTCIFYKPLFAFAALSTFFLFVLLH